MFTYAFIANIVVLALGGLLLLVGLLLLGYGIFALLQARRAPVAEVPSYSTPVDYPAEAGMDGQFEDTPQWADQIAAGDETGDVDTVRPAASTARIKHGRETGLVAVGALLAMIGLFMLLNSITLLA